MPAIKQSIINHDQSDKKWLTEDYDQHWIAPKTKSKGMTINRCLFFIAVLLTPILYVAVRGF